MQHKKTYFHSPFSKHTVCLDNNRSLLLQFILFELFQANICLHKREEADDLFFSYPYSYPLDCASHVGIINRLEEHADLLAFAFTPLFAEAKEFSQTLTSIIDLFTKDCSLHIDREKKIGSYLKTLFIKIEPFLEALKHDEKLLFFLLKHHKQIALLTHDQYLLDFFLRTHPEGLDSLQEFICDHFHERGFSILIPKVKTFIGELQKVYV